MDESGRGLWAQSGICGANCLIFCTVGNSPRGFDRMLRAVEAAAESVDDSFVYQTGYSGYTPRSGESFRFMDRDRYLGTLNTCRLMVTHGGAGTVIDARVLGKPIVIFPRRAGLGECTEDFFLELATALAGEGLAEVCEDVGSLVRAMAADSVSASREYPAMDRRLVQALEVYLCQLLSTVNSGR